MIINGGIQFWKHLTVLFNNCLSKGIYPDSWNYANITAIPKPGKDHSNPANYRPIAVSSCLGRIYEKVLAKRLQQHCINHKIFDNLQCGFQINRNTEDILTSFITDASHNIDKHSEMDCIFTDFSKAYDSVWINGLLYKLINLGINNNYLRVIKQFLNTRYNRITLKNAKSTWKHRNLGLPQGSSLSPILYIIFTHDFKIKYKKFNRMGCFADDTAFWQSPAPQNRQRKHILQREINRFTDWCKYWKLRLNPSKCTQLSISKHISNNKLNEYKIDNIPINKIDKTKYLGIYFDNKFNFKYHIDTITNKVNGKYYKIKYLQNNGLSLSPKSLSNIYKTIYRPQIEYGLIYSFPYDTNNKIQKLQNKFLHLITPSKLSCPTDILHITHNIEPIQIRYKFLILRHWARAIHCSKYHPLYKTYENYTKYRYKDKYKPTKQQYIKHPFYAANEINDKQKPTTATIIKQYNKQAKIIRAPISALPLYNNKIPANYKIILKPENINKDTAEIYHRKKIILIYTDGSCVPNPGKGACAILQPGSKIINKYHKQIQFKYPITITIAEINGIIKALKLIYQQKIQYPNKYNYIIKTDCKLILQYLQFTNFPKYQSTKIMIDQIFEILNNINKIAPKCTITIAKCTAHSNDIFNNEVDKLAKRAANNTYYTTKEIDKTPYQVTMTETHKYCKNEWKNSWYNRTSNNKYKMIQNNISIIYKKLHILSNHMNTDQLAIMIRLITGHIELNSYYHKYKIKLKDNNNQPLKSPNCTKCQTPETISHYILKCKLYKKQRTKLINKISKISNEYHNGANITMNNIIFPNIKIIPLNKIPTIWKEILSYIRNTNRFNKIYGINIENI